MTCEVFPATYAELTIIRTKKEARDVNMCSDLTIWYETSDMMPIPAAAMITDWLPDNQELFPSQYGMTRNYNWLRREARRIPWAKFVYKGALMGLVDRRLL